MQQSMWSQRVRQEFVTEQEQVFAKELKNNFSKTRITLGES